jgi:hypothetical protein
MIELQERLDVLPICPICKDELKSIAYQELQGIFGKRFVYFCNQCRAVLGVSHRKGFWMG